MIDRRSFLKSMAVIGAVTAASALIGKDLIPKSNPEPTLMGRSPGFGLDPNKWYHLAVTKENGLTYVWVNGIPIGTTTEFWYMDGSIDQFKITVGKALWDVWDDVGMRLYGRDSHDRMFGRCGDY